MLNILCTEFYKWIQKSIWTFMNENYSGWGHYNYFYFSNNSAMKVHWDKYNHILIYLIKHILVPISLHERVNIKATYYTVLAFKNFMGKGRKRVDRSWTSASRAVKNKLLLFEPPCLSNVVFYYGSSNKQTVLG